MSDDGTFFGEDACTDETRVLEWEEIRHPAFGDIAGPYLVTVANFIDRKEFQIRDGDNEPISSSTLPNRDDDQPHVESVLKNKLATAALLAASWELRKAATYLVDLLNGEVGHMPPTHEELDKRVSGLIRAIAKANGYDAEIFSGEVGDR